MYAAKTDVPVGRTRQAIEDLLAKAKCAQFVIGSDSESHKAMVQFRFNNRIVRFTISLPDTSDTKYTHVNQWRRRALAQVTKLVAQAERQRWRALFLVIKAKLEAVESGITTFEEEFLAHIVLPDDSVVSDHIVPRLAQVYEQQDTRRLLAAHGD